ncbi:MAG: hypothetical protein K2H35_01770 [Muribaculaceae bacterium]|nr:hypothetical protein [Muribaculaceae bacterium]
MKNLLRRKYILVPALLFIYGAAMAAIFGPDLIKSGRKWYLITFLIADPIICLLTFFFMRKRYRILH